ncbi:MAG: DHHA1 domain-containing protein [Candidatus Methanospirareceae archaeon]
MQEAVQKAVQKAAEKIKKHNYARVVSHYDADGITSAGILCNALLRAGIQFHATIVSKLERDFVQELREGEEGLVIFCDMGTGQLDLILEHLKETDVVILDHHSPPSTFSSNFPPPTSSSSSSSSSSSPSSSPPSSSPPSSSSPAPSSSLVLVNPCLSAEGREGGEVCAAGLSYLVARCLSENERGNCDLAGLAVAGSLGDKQDLSSGLNKEILDEAVREGVVSVKRGLRLGGGKIRDLLLFATDPYLPLAGKPEWVDAFLKKVGTGGVEGEKKLSDLTAEEVERLTAALSSLSALSQELVGAVYVFNFEVVRDGTDFMRLVDACGRFGKAGVGIGLCLREESAVEEATSLHTKFQNKLVSELNRINKEEGGSGGAGVVKELPNIFYFFVQESGVTGVLAGIVAEYLRTKKPVVALNTTSKSAETKISARCSSRLFKSGGLDLAEALEKASREVGGFGGGHPVAAGATVPAGSEEKFVAALDKKLLGKGFSTNFKKV